MMVKENSDKITDQAWGRLYSRLEKDGLVPEEKKPRLIAFRSPAFRWAVSAAVVVICIVSLWLFRSTDAANSRMYTLHNGKDSPTLVTMLEDGSVVYLLEHTSLQYPTRFDAGKREVILHGDAFFEVSGNKNRPFIIDAGTATVEVLGTAFNVKNMDNAPFSLSVRNGEVKVTLKETGQTVNVGAGESVQVVKGLLNLEKKKESEKFSQYMERIHFKDERLADVIRIINMNSDSVRLDLAPGLGDRRLNVSFTGDSPDVMARLICLALNLDYSRRQNTITISAFK